MDGNDVVHVADSANRRVVARTKVGAVVAIWELSDNTTSKIHAPVRVATGGGKIYLVDNGNHHISVLTLDRTQYSQN